jgi:membrane protease YdiL (CAAX protease family)
MTSIALAPRRYAVIVFGTLTILLTFATYLLPLPREALAFVMVWIPAVLAIILTAINEGSSGVRSLLGQLTHWRISLKWLLTALLVTAAMRLAISLIALGLGWIPSIQLRPLSALEVVLLAVIFMIAAIPEELGWRGYALRKLLANHSALYASLVIGVLWGLVHLALHLPGMPSEGLPGVLTIFQLIGLSVLLTWLYIRGGKNIILTSIFHAAQSFLVILNEGVTLEQQVWLMAVVWLSAGAMVILMSQPMRVTTGS